MKNKTVSVIGIDLAKNVFQLHGVNSQGKTIMQKKVSRSQLKEIMAAISPCLVGMEASGSANYWARTFAGMGHTVKLMSPQYVKPYVKSNKNDRNDAEGICEAVTRPTMRFVPIKTVAQQDMQSQHRVRSRLVGQRTQLSNQIRGFLGEYGIVIPQGYKAIRSLPSILDDTKNGLTSSISLLFRELYEEFLMLDTRITQLEKRIFTLAKENSSCKRLQAIPGIGPLTASAFVTSISNGREFKTGRQVSGLLGLIPRQHSSAGRERLGGISKRGDRYLRSLLIHGARSVMRNCDKKTDSHNLWIQRIKERRGFNKAAVALANKNARIAWALLAHDTDFDIRLTAHVCTKTQHQDKKLLSRENFQAQNLVSGALLQKKRKKRAHICAVNAF